jgi:hypothetical protein
MLFPRTHAWTPLQKWLIVTTAITLIALCGAGIYYYERHSRTTDGVLIDLGISSTWG